MTHPDIRGPNSADTSTRGLVIGFALATLMTLAAIAVIALFFALTPESLPW